MVDHPHKVGECAESNYTIIAIDFTIIILLLQAFIKRHISGTSPFIGAYTHYNKMYIESYKIYLKMYSMVYIHVHS